MMGRTRRQELFWLVLIGLCVALFVAQRERGGQEKSISGYDRGGMSVLVRHAMNAPVVKGTDPDADIVTGSLAAKPVSRPSADRGGRYYVTLGTYDSVDRATRRYLDILGRQPDLRDNEKLSIETVTREGGRPLQRVRMGAFESRKAARAACARAGLPSRECRLTEIR
jgi:hypothetical protein